MHSYASSYEEPMQEVAEVAVYDPSSPQIPEIEKGNKLLSFQRSTCSLGLLDYSMRQTSVSLAAQLHGMFFLAKSSRADSEDMSGTPAELTCYRRNLFQITGYATVPRMIQSVVTDQGDRLPIVSQRLSISASESVEGSPVKIISVPFKPSATGAPPMVEEKTEKEPTPVQLDQTSSHEVDGEFNIYPFAWKRLQFRVATANNGRRKELQQHFTVRLFVTATLSNGAEVSICQALSGPIVVRGRSPRNFQTKEDVPLPDSRPPGRKSGSSPSASRRLPTEPQQQVQMPVAQEVDMTSNDGYTFTQTPASHQEWRHFSPSSSTTLPSSTLPSTPNVSPYVKHEPELKRVRNPSLKRKSSFVDPKMALMLSIPQETATQQTRSAPPERPRKSSRHALASSAQTYMSEDPSTLPTNAFRFASIMGNPTYTSNGTGRTTTGESAELMYSYYPGVEDWVYPPGQDYQSTNGTQGHSVGGILCPPTARWG
ncbi:hypothetical protein MMC34_001840 [Xylographa carneopallida]|nr:hypothetical protein [Xylographa carneopallida]